ncbi:MAG: Crp/Fnr family transcriptional regulator [Nitrospira sp.]
MEESCCTSQRKGSRRRPFQLEGEDLHAFDRIKIPITYKANQTVFYEGHASLGLYMLCSGKVKLTRSSIKGQRVIVRILEGGDIIEKEAFGDKTVHQVTCETLEPCKICLIERAPYLELVKRNGALALSLIELLSSEVRSHIGQLDEFLFKNARERLAAKLLQLALRFGFRVEGGVSIGMNLKREEVAEMAGITPETLARLLGAFQGEKLITVHGRTITLVDIDRLSRIARYPDLKLAQVSAEAPAS